MIRCQIQGCQSGITKGGHLPPGAACWGSQIDVRMLRNKCKISNASGCFPAAKSHQDYQSSQNDQSRTLLNVFKRSFGQGRNEVRWRPGQETSLALPCSNLRSFGSKCSAMEKVLVTLLAVFGASCSHSPIVIRRPGNCATFAPLVTPLSSVSRTQRPHVVGLATASQCFQIARVANFPASLSFHSFATIGRKSSVHSRGEHGQVQDWIFCRILAIVLDQDWIWVFIFEKNWIRTGSRYLFDFYNEISLRVIQDVTNDHGACIFFTMVLIFTKNQNDFVIMCCTHYNQW